MPGVVVFTMLDLMKRESKNDASGLHGELLPLSEALIRQMETEWAALVRSPAEPNAFMTLWMVRPALPLLQEVGAKLFAVRHEGRLVGVTFLAHDRGYAHLPLGVMRSALHCHQFLGTPLVLSGHETAFAEALCDWLNGLSDETALCQLTHLEGEGPVAAALRSVADMRGLRCDEVDRHQRAMIAEDSSYEDYLAKHVSSKRRKKLGRLRRRLEEQGKVEVETLSDIADLAGWTEGFIAMEHLGWKGDAGTSVQSSAIETDFFNNFLLAAAEAEALRFARLTLNGEALAYTIDLKAGREVFALKVAYDPAWSRFSPGVLLEMENLKYYLEEPDIARVDSCAAPDHSVLSHLWGQEKEIVQLVIGRSGLRHRWLLSLARLLEGGAASARSLAGELKK